MSSVLLSSLAREGGSIKPVISTIGPAMEPQEPPLDQCVSISLGLLEQYNYLVGHALKQI